MSHRTEGVVILEGIEPVRLRPGMYIGDIDARGLEHLLLEVVGNSVDQYLSGDARRVEVDIDEHWVTVRDDGAGMAQLEAPPHGALNAFETVFTHLHAGATRDGHHPHVHVRPGLHGVGLAVVSALSQRLEVRSTRNGIAWEAAFEAGRVVTPVHATGATDQRGTRIRYRPDPLIFKDARHDHAALQTRFRLLGTLASGLDLTLQGTNFRRKEGLAGLLLELAPRALRETTLVARGLHEDVEVELALGWDPDARSEQVRTFLNYSAIDDGGTAPQGLLDAIRSVTQARTGADAENRVVALVHVMMLHPRFEGPTRNHLISPEARVAVREILGRALAEAPWWWDRVHEAHSP